LKARSNPSLATITAARLGGEARKDGQLQRRHEGGPAQRAPHLVFGYRSSSQYAVANPTIPPPIMATSTFCMTVIPSGACDRQGAAVHGCLT